MKKTTTNGKLMLKPETVKVLENTDLKDVVGGGPKPTRDTPCIPPPP